MAPMNRGTKNGLDEYLSYSQIPKVRELRTLGEKEKERETGLLDRDLNGPQNQESQRDCHEPETGPTTGHHAADRRGSRLARLHCCDLGHLGTIGRHE